MSRAFVREQEDSRQEAMPDLPISPHPNFVTPRGLAMIESKLREIDEALRATEDAEQRARLQRDQRYWSARRATAQLIEPDENQADEVTFGARVTFQREGRPPETIEIVGQDEADPAEGRLSFLAPIAAALMGARPGETVEVGGRTPPMELTVLAVDHGGLRSKH